VLTLLLVAGSVGLDNFAASIAIGLSGVDRQLRVRIAVVFGIFEAGMPVIGLLAGRGLSGTLGARAHSVGGGLLILAGAQMAVAALRSGGDDDEPAALSGVPLGRLLVLGAGLSIDNLVIGFALGARNSPLVLAVVVIGVISVGLSLLGLELGSRVGGRVEQWSELLGAGVLVLVGLAILTRVL
jgi:manganese efflux pump family protein